MKRTPKQKWIFISSIIILTLLLILPLALFIPYLVINIEDPEIHVVYGVIFIAYFITMVLLLLVIFINAIIILSNDWKDEYLNKYKILYGVLSFFFGPIPGIIFGAIKPAEKKPEKVDIPNSLE